MIPDFILSFLNFYEASDFVHP